jgi:2-methylcitrate dehydratase PrpD
MEIRLLNGRTLNTRVEQFRGAGERPLSQDEVVAKFRECAGTVLDASRVERVLAMIDNLGALKDAVDLTALLAA